MLVHTVGMPVLPLFDGPRPWGIVSTPSRKALYACRICVGHRVCLLCVDGRLTLASCLSLLPLCLCGICLSCVCVSMLLIAPFSPPLSHPIPCSLSCSVTSLSCPHPPPRRALAFAFASPLPVSPWTRSAPPRPRAMPFYPGRPGVILRRHEINPFGQDGSGWPDHGRALPEDGDFREGRRVRCSRRIDRVRAAGDQTRKCQEKRGLGLAWPKHFGKRDVEAGDGGGGLGWMC